jgi:hypothetical protein
MLGGDFTMRKPKTDPNRNRRVNFWLGEEDYGRLKTLAVQRNRSISETMRELVIHQLNIAAAKSDEDSIRKYMREELENVMKPKVERIIKLLMRIGIMSTSFCFFNLKLVDAIIPPDAEGKRSYEELFTEAKKDSAVYLYISDAHLEAAFREFDKNHQ